jgi:hypothetical protein
MVSENEKLVVFLTEGLKTLNLKSRIETERESDSELWINLLDLGVSIFSDEEGTTRRKIGGGTIKVPSYQVYTVTWVAATREQPEEMDHTLRRECDRIDSAVAEVFSLVVKDTIFNMIEAKSIEMDL